MNLSNSELELIEAARCGDEKAWHYLVFRYFKVLMSATSGFGLSFEDREDVIQETFLKLISSIKNYDPKRANFITYIITIAIHSCIDKLRKKKKISDILAYDQERIFFVETEQNIDDIQEKMNILQEAIENKLKPEQKLVIRLFYLEGLSYSQIAHIMNHDYNWVKNTLYRTVEYLRKITVNK